MSSLAQAAAVWPVAVAWPGPMRLATLLLIAPLAEETLFRAGLQEALLRRGRPRWLANGLTAAAFALAHALAWGEIAAVAVAAPALALGACYGRWRRLRWCIALHALMNAAGLALPWLMP